MVSIQKKRERERVVIHSNSTGFVKLLLSTCHHKSHFDLVFLGAVPMPNFASLSYIGSIESLGGLSRTHTKKRRPLVSEREGKRQTIRDSPLRRKP